MCGTLDWFRRMKPKLFIVNRKGTGPFLIYCPLTPRAKQGKFPVIIRHCTNTQPFGNAGIGETDSTVMANDMCASRVASSALG